MRYVSKPAECEAMQWGLTASRDTEGAGVIVAWVKAHGGEARYETAHHMVDPIYRDVRETQPARIAVRTISGWAYAAPGDYVVMGSAVFCAHDEYGQPGHVCDGTHDFYPCDPATFEKRWQVPS